MAQGLATSLPLADCLEVPMWGARTDGEMAGRTGHGHGPQEFSVAVRGMIEAMSDSAPKGPMCKRNP